MKGVFPFITLKAFPGGYSSHGKIKKLLKEDYYDSLKLLKDEDIEEIAFYLNGIKPEIKLFETLSWSLYINPIPDLEIYFLCERGEEKDDFSVVYSRKSINIPTEDVYAFTMMYIITLSKIAKGELIYKRNDIPKTFTSLKKYLKGRYKDIVSNFLKILTITDKNFLNKKISKFSHVIYRKEKDKNLIILYRVFDDFLIKFKFGEEKDIAVPEEALKNHGEKIVFTLVGLILNAIKREIFNFK